MSIVVLPVPGPPVMTIAPFFSAVSTAFLCCGASGILSSFSRAFICAFMPSISCMPSREAMPISRRAHSLSALYMPGKNTASVLSISLYSTSPEMISSSSISSAGRVSTCRSWQATLKSFSRGRKVCPSCRAHCSVYLSPALMRNGESGSKPAFTANLSAVMKPMPSISSISLYGFSFSLAMHSAPYVL